MRLATAFVVTWLSSGCWSSVPTRWDRRAFDHEQGVRVLGCAELGFSITRDAAGLLLDVSLLNRCSRAVGMDLSSLSLTGRDESGAEQPLALYDPRNEVRAYQLDAFADGTERLRIDGSSALEGTSVVCLDLSRVSAEAIAARPERLCLYAPRAPVVEEEDP